MNEAQIFAAFLIVALLGWGVTNALNSRTSIIIANAFSVLEKLDARFDARINAIIARIRNAREEGKQLPASRASEEEESRGGSGSGYVPVADMFTPQTMPFDQPDADDGLEVVS